MRIWIRQASPVSDGQVSDGFAALAVIKAINATRLAMHGDRSHFVSLDEVIRTMRDTGRDVHSTY